MSAPSVRLRADEVVERGLRLYAQGDLEGALAEWRRALEIEPGNRRGRDYLVYVEEHFKVLSEKFRAARERHGPGSGPPIEMEADDPMEDIDPYESIELQGQPSIAPFARDTSERTTAERARTERPSEDVDAEAATAPAPPAPHLRDVAAIGKHAGGRRPWGGRKRDSEDMWPTDESWPPASRNDTLEMSVDPSCLDDLDDLAAGEIGSSPFDDEDEDEEDVVLGERMLDSQRLDDLAAEVAEDEEAQEETGEITLPARRRQQASTAPAAEGSGPLETRGLPGVGSRGEGREGNGFDLSDFASSRGMVRVSQSAADEEAWADGTPPTEDVDDEALAQLRELREEELREVRVTFRRPSRITHQEPTERAGDDEDDDDAQDADEAGAEVDEDDVDVPIAPPTGRYRLEDLDSDDDDDLDDDEDEDERTQERRAHQPSDPARGSRPTSRHTRPVAHPRPPRRLSSEGSDLVASAVRLAEEQSAIGRDPAPADSPVAQDRPAGRARRRSSSLRAVSEGDEAVIERATTEMRAARRPMAHSAVSIELVSSELLTELDRALQSPPRGADDLVRERIGWLLERARNENLAGHFPVAVVAIDLALDENPESAVAQKLIHSNRELLFEIYGNYLGDPSAVPGLALPMSAIPMSELDHRAAFLLSRVDGVLSIEDVLDVAGMARLEAFRHLSRLMLRGILEIRP